MAQLEYNGPTNLTKAKDV